MPAEPRTKVKELQQPFSRYLEPSVLLRSSLILAGTAIIHPHRRALQRGRVSSDTEQHLGEIAIARAFILCFLRLVPCPELPFHERLVVANGLTSAGCSSRAVPNPQPGLARSTLSFLRKDAKKHCRVEYSVQGMLRLLA
jgi:hypothetical protein